MKKIFYMLIILSAQVSLYAGSLDYLTNQSAKICMTFHRAAATDASADIVNYNPAGTAFLEKGLYLDLSSQTLFKYYSESGKEAGGEPGSLEQDEPTPVLPNFYAVYSFGSIGPVRHAVYFQAGIVAGVEPLTGKMARLVRLPSMMSLSAVWLRGLQTIRSAYQVFITG